MARVGFDLAWAAGFWDGEGCASVSVRGRNGNPRLVLQIAQVDRRVLDRFRDAVGFGSVLGPYEQANKNASPFFVWRVEGSTHAERLLEAIGPHLSAVKLQQLSNGIARRKAWESEARCAEGHVLTRSKRGHLICRKCFSISNKRTADARWRGNESEVI